MSKPKPKSKGLLARASQWLKEKIGSPSSKAPSSQPSTPNAPKIVLSAAPAPSEAHLHAPLSSSVPALGVPEPPPPALSHSALPLPVPTSQTSSLHIPPAPQDVPSSGYEGGPWSGLRSALQTLHTNSVLFPPLQSVIGELLSSFEMFEEPTRNQRECETLALELKMMSETLDRHLQGSNTVPNMDSIVKIIQAIQEKVDLIAKEQNSNLGRHLVKAEQLTEILSTCDRLIQVLCRQLQLDVGLGGRNQLKDLDPAKLAAYDSRLAIDTNRRACTENSQTNVLSNIRAWLLKSDAPKVCWLIGVAGSGKTTIAYTLAQELEKNKQLAASFFCTRTEPQCRRVARVIPTIAYQLARKSAPFIQPLCRILRDDPDVLSRSMQNQFEQLLKQPLLEVKDKLPGGLVVVIDALDECTARKKVKLVLDMLLQEAPNLPLKFFITSRPMPGIRNKIQEQPESVRSLHELHTIKRSDGLGLTNNLWKRSRRHHTGTPTTSTNRPGDDSGFGGLSDTFMMS